jgi:hypothetical protein
MEILPLFPKPETTGTVGRAILMACCRAIPDAINSRKTTCKLRHNLKMSNEFM